LLFRPLRIQISQRQEAETRLLEANHDLEHRVSERTRSLNTALAESEQSQEKIRCILNCITEALLVVDSQDKIALVNPLAEDLFEVEESRVLHKPLSCLFFDDTFSKKTEIAKTQIVNLAVMFSFLRTSQNYVS
jgi:transcriptional regulator of aromatic amino acid metabolism